MKSNFGYGLESSYGKNIESVLVGSNTPPSYYQRTVSSADIPCSDRNPCDLDK